MIRYIIITKISLVSSFLISFLGRIRVKISFSIYSNFFLNEITIIPKHTYINNIINNPIVREVISIITPIIGNIRNIVIELTIEFADKSIAL